MCAHILAVTHVILASKPKEEQKRLAICNLKLMGTKLTSKKKSGAKWLKGKKKNQDLHYLQKHSSGSEDESSEEDSDDS
jgi:hypothetical protein